MAPVVILLHGLGQTPFSMARMAAALRRAGRDVHNLGYPSRGGTIRELAAGVWQRVHGGGSGPDGPVDFVTHSLGGIIARQIGVDHPGSVRRAVLIAPPNRGTELAELVRRCGALRWLLGPAALEVGCEPGSVPNRLGPPDFEAGVIAGAKPDNPLTARLIPGTSDGRVSVAGTVLEGMADHIVVPYGHLMIMARGEVIRQAEHFLREGAFSSDSHLSQKSNKWLQRSQ